MNATALWRRASCVTALLLATLQAAAQTFPSKPLDLIVPYPAGGASDFIARLIQPEYQKQLGQPMIVDNVGGVSGALGIQKLLAAPPDGHTQVLGTPMELVLAPLALQAVKFKPDDLRLAGVIGSTVVVLLVRRDLPATTLDEFIAWAHGKQPSYGSVGIGSLYHLMAEKFAAQTGLAFTHVPYKGGGPLVNDLAGGTIDMAFFPLAGPVPGLLRDGKVRALGISAAQPHALWPTVPPLSAHALLRDFVFDLWVGVELPRATPDATLARVHQALAAVLNNAEVRHGLEANGSLVPGARSQAELDAFYAAEIARYRAIARSIHLQPQ